jgi:HSP20 family molecular chaperone IbpA
MFIVSRPRFYDFHAERAAEIEYNYIRRQRILQARREAARREAARREAAREAALAAIAHRREQQCALENVFSFANEFNRLSSFVFDDAFTSLIPKVNTSARLEFSETEDEYKFALKLADGLTKDNLTINVTDDRVTIEGKVGFDETVDDETFDDDAMETEAKVEEPTTEDIEVDGLVEDFVDVSPEEKAASPADANVPATNEVVTKDDVSSKDVIAKEPVRKIVYKRSFTLPEDSNIESLKAKFGENVLTLTVEKKKAPVVTPREIVIE